MNALLRIAGTKVLDKAQLRTIEGQKSVLKIGQRIPYATGSFSPGGFGGGSSLVNTQFQYFDVGLNIDVTAKVHEPDEVSLHIESDTSAVAERVDIGGIIQPVISQRKRVADVRVKEGEVNFWDIVTQRQDIKNSNGLPGLSQIPILGRAFNNEKLIQTELQVLTLLIPHIIRAPDIRDVNLMGLPSGSDQTVRLRYSTPEGRTIAARTTNEVVELKPAPGNTGQFQQQQQQPQQQQQQPGFGMGVPQQQFGGMTQPNPGGMGMGGMQPQTAPGPMGGMTGTVPQPGMPMGPGTTQPGPAPTGPARIVFNPSTLQIPVGRSISTEVVLDGVPENVTGELVLQFDPRAIRVTATPGPGVESIDSANIQQTGRITLKVNRGGTTRQLVRLSVEAVTAGPTAIAPGSFRFVNAQGGEVAVVSGAAGIDVVGGD